MPIYVLSFLTGVVSGMRAFTAPAAVSWAARLGWLPLENSGLAFLGYAYAPYILTVLAVGELVNDKLPKTPSRKAPPSFIVRIISGAMCGAALGIAGQSMMAGLVAGALGSLAGTLGGYELRSRIVKATGGKDLPIALLEDVCAVGLAAWTVSRF